MDTQTILLFLIATLAINLSPGPSILYVTSVAVSYGLRAAIASVLGMSVGIFVHVFAAVVGISTLVATSATAFMVLKYIGAAYLVFLGLRLLLTSSATEENELHGPSTQSIPKLFWRGVLVDLLNPKIALFFLAFLPQFAGSNDGAYVRVFGLGCVFILVGGIVNGCIAWAAVKGVRIAKPRCRTWIVRWIPGSVLVGMGIRLSLVEP